MARRKKQVVGPVEVRRVTEPEVPPDAEVADEAHDEVEEHDGWQPVRPRRSSAPPDR